MVTQKLKTSLLIEKKKINLLPYPLVPGPSVFLVTTGERELLAESV
jgi:hypothetical protein